MRLIRPLPEPARVLASTEGMLKSLFAVTLIIVLILVVGPILYWIVRGLYRSVRSSGRGA